MQLRAAAVALLPALVAADCGTPFPDCADNMTCFQLTPYADEAYVFDCAYANATGAAKGNVYFMHGNDGPKSKAMWSHMMTAVALEGYNSLACDQRGYSPGASPANASDYDYGLLVEDVFAVADAHFGSNGRFHVVAHDQGARVAWHALAFQDARQRFATFSSLSIPHLDAFSDMLFGDDPEEEEQSNYGYVRQLTLPNSTTAFEANIWNKVCLPAGYETPAACQPAMWWYAGAYSSGAMALQPYTEEIGMGPIGDEIGIPAEYVLAHTPYPDSGFAQTSKTGNITELPVLYVCGEGEVADLCNDRADKATAQYIADYTFLSVAACGHCLTSPAHCFDYQKVIDAVVAQIKKADR